MTGRVRDMILNPDETGKLPEVIAEGAYYGMQTFDQALLRHVQNSRIAMEEARQGVHAPARLQAARVLRRSALHVGRVGVRGRCRQPRAGRQRCAGGARGLSALTS